MQVFQRMHCHIFHLVTSATALFGTKHYAIHLTSLPAQCASACEEQIQTDDLCMFDTPDMEVKKVEAAMKFFVK